jgi:hypothetical protein
VLAAAAGLASSAAAHAAFAPGSVHPSAAPPRWETARGGSGTVTILGIESLRIAADGTYWFGEEFGPFLVHTDNTGSDFIQIKVPH